MTGLLETLLIAAFATLPAVEIALASPLVRLFHALVLHSEKAFRLINSKRISDHWKERILPAYAFFMLRASLLLLVWLTALLGVFLAGLAVGAWAFAGKFPDVEVLQRLDLMLFSFLIAVIYLGVRPYIFRHA